MKTEQDAAIIIFLSVALLKLCTSLILCSFDVAMEKLIAYR